MNKEINLKKILSASKVEPEKSWQNMTLERLKLISEENSVTSLNQSRNKLVSLFINLSTMKKVMLAFSFLGVLAIFLLSGVIVSNQLSGKKVSIESKFSESEQKVIIENISNFKIKPEDKKSLFVKTQITSTKGVASSQCKELLTGIGDIGINAEYVNFNDNEHNYGKQKQMDVDGNLIYYSIGETTRKDSLLINYRGGKYAIKEDARISDSIPNENQLSGFPTSISQDTSPISGIYGYGAKVIDEQTIDGINYYIVEYKFTTDCNAKFGKISVDEKNNLKDQIIVRMLVRKDNYQQYKSYYYLGSVEDNNLIFSNTKNIEVNNKSFKEIASEFNFDYPNVKIKSMGEPDPDSTPVNDPYDANDAYQSVMNIIKSNNLSILILEDNAFKLNYIDDGIPHLKKQNVVGEDDRNFYPAGEFGDLKYEERMSANNVNVLETYGLKFVYIPKSPKDSRPGIDIYINAANPNDTVSNSSINLPRSLIPTTNDIQVKVKIDNDFLDSDLIESYLGDNKQNASYYLNLKYKGIEYSIDFGSMFLPSGNRKPDISKLSLKSYDPSNPEQLKELDSMIKTMIMTPHLW